MKSNHVWLNLLMIALFARRASPQAGTGPRPEPLYEARGAFGAFIVTDVNASVAWYESCLGMHEPKSGRSPRVAAETVVLGGHSVFVELIHYTDRMLTKRQIDDAAPIAGRVKMGAIVSTQEFEALAKHLREHGAETGIFSGEGMGVRSFIVRDNDGNRLQFFAYRDRS